MREGGRGGGGQGGLVQRAGRGSQPGIKVGVRVCISFLRSLLLLFYFLLSPVFFLAVFFPLSLVTSLVPLPLQVFTSLFAFVSLPLPLSPHCSVLMSSVLIHCPYYYLKYFSLVLMVSPSFDYTLPPSLYT